MEEPRKANAAAAERGKRSRSLDGTDPQAPKIQIQYGRLEPCPARKLEVGTSRATIPAGKGVCGRLGIAQQMPVLPPPACHLGVQLDAEYEDFTASPDHGRATGTLSFPTIAIQAARQSSAQGGRHGGAGCSSSSGQPRPSDMAMPVRVDDQAQEQAGLAQ